MALEESSLKGTKLLLGESDNASSTHSLPGRLENNINLLKLEKGKLDSEQQIFQAYITAKDSWLKDREALIGTSEIPNTIKYFEEELKYLNDTLPEEIEKNMKNEEI
ncbi:hypothetical protein P4S72_15240 [Vibrio sp. PP-XX7]